MKVGEHQKALAELKQLKYLLSECCRKLALSGDQQSIDYAKVILGACNVVAILEYRVSQSIPKKKGVKNG